MSVSMIDGHIDEVMSDEQIVRALECCEKDDCDNCPNCFGNCYANLAGYSLSLINRQKAEIERLEKMLDKRCDTCPWVSIEERLPDRDGRYLICDKFGNINMRRFVKGAKYPFDISPDHKQYYMPTHWAELPEAPK